MYSYNVSHVRQSRLCLPFHLNVLKKKLGYTYHIFCVALNSWIDEWCRHVCVYILNVTISLYTVYVVFMYTHKSFVYCVVCILCPFGFVVASQEEQMHI